MNTQINEKWELILDLVGGPVTLWPRVIHRLFWKRNLNYLERFKVACFIWVNGLNPEIFFDWAVLVGGIHPNNTHGWAHIRGLFTKFNRDGWWMSHYWGWNVDNGRFEYLNGRTRYYP